MAEADPKALARALTRLRHLARGTGEGEDWYQVPVSLMNLALAALERIPELERENVHLSDLVTAARRVVGYLDEIDPDIDRLEHALLDEALAALDEASGRG